MLLRVRPSLCMCMYSRVATGQCTVRRETGSTGYESSMHRLHLLRRPFPRKKPSSHHLISPDRDWATGCDWLLPLIRRQPLRACLRLSLVCCSIFTKPLYLPPSSPLPPLVHPPSLPPFLKQETPRSIIRGLQNPGLLSIAFSDLAGIASLPPWIV